MGAGRSLRSSDASAEVVGRLAGGTGGGALTTPERKSYESWILGGMGMGHGSATSNIAYLFAIQHNPYSCWCCGYQRKTKRQEAFSMEMHVTRLSLSLGDKNHPSTPPRYVLKKSHVVWVGRDKINLLTIHRAKTPRSYTCCTCCSHGFQAI